MPIPRAQTAEGAADLLAEYGWVLGPPTEAQTWLLDVRQACRHLGWKITAGTTEQGLPWVARTDLSPEEEQAAMTPWFQMDVRPRRFFLTYPPPLTDPDSGDLVTVVYDDSIETAEELAAELVEVLTVLATPTPGGETTPLDNARAIADGDQVAVTLDNGMTFRMRIELMDDGTEGYEPDLSS